MKLKHYLQHRRNTYGRKGSARLFAKELGITEDYLSKISRGKRSPGLKLVLRIIERSHGNMNIDDFKEDT